ncbi:MAG: hypothetical protein EP319_07320 [Deltaproteobacteria bacterium]|nr:MAG: hypothetical protein EP319_07320 [Deltaproteobacteria bacterium]
MRMLTVFFFIIGFMSSTGAFGHVHCEQKKFEGKHEINKGECENHSRSKSHKSHSSKAKTSNCMVVCSVCTLTQFVEQPVIISPSAYLGQINFLYGEENPRSFNYRLFRPPIA